MKTKSDNRPNYTEELFDNNQLKFAPEYMMIVTVR